MSRQGGHRLSLQDVAEEAGVSKGLILYHFQSKENLLLETMRYALMRTESRIRQELKAVHEPNEVIAALVDAIFVSPQENREFYLLYLDLVEHAARIPSFGELSSIATGIMNALYEEIVRDGVARGGFAGADPVAAAATMRALIEGTFLGWLQEKDWETAHPRFKELCHAGLLQLLGAE